MTRNAFYVFIGLLLFTAGASWFYLCKIKKVCGQEHDTTAGSALKSSIGESIVFQWGDAEPMRGQAFETMYEQLKQEIAGNQLEIIGLYDADEVNNTAYENLGMARGEQVKNLFSDLPTQVFISSEEVEIDQDLEYFRGVKMNVIFGHIHQTEPTDSI